MWTPVYLQIDLKDVTMKIKDGTGTPLEITIKIGEGNLTYTESRTMEYTLDRGTLDEVREGDEVPMDVSFDFVWEYIIGDDTTTTNTPTIEDVLKRQGLAAAWVSTDADGCRPYAVDIEIKHSPSCTAGAPAKDEETITLPDFRYETLEHDLRNGTVSVTGRCNAKVATVSRA
jgi:hypothetical protein